MSTPSMMRRALVAAGLAIGLTASASPALAASGHDCRLADLQPTRSNAKQITRGTICLLNQQRVRHGLGKLHANRALRGAANRYARTMVTQRFFEHVSPAGSTFVQRIAGTNYLRGARGYAVGENLAWGGDGTSTPRTIVDAWMASPGHRANILNGAYRDIGVGVVARPPVASVRVGATYVNEFGQRSR